MKICILASGSKGNSAYIETNETKSLVDLGMSAGYIAKALKNIDVDPSSIQRVFITHTHSDHVAGLKVFLKKYHPTVYLTRKMEEELDFDIEDKAYLEEDISIADLDVKVIKTSHDAADSNGFVFSSLDKSVVYITDTGYIHVKNFDKLKNKNVYVFESNHDVRMLREGKYPYYLQQRILSDKGHLSNRYTGSYLNKTIGKNTKYIILAHLSENNNTPELALEQVKEQLSDIEFDYEKIIVAKQYEETEMVEV